MSDENGKVTVEQSDELNELGRELRERADEVRREVIRQLHNTADSIRGEAKKRKARGETRETANTIATGLEKTANYLNSRTVDTLGEDATHVVQRNPWRFMALLFAIGMAIGIFFRRDP